jgi:uncharacterized protein YodC (DUF2158 family)
MVSKKKKTSSKPVKNASTEQEQFNVGDIVQLKSGSDIMTVVKGELDENGNIVVSWYEGGNIKWTGLPPGCFEKA